MLNEAVKFYGVYWWRDVLVLKLINSWPSYGCTQPSGNSGDSLLCSIRLRPFGSGQLIGSRGVQDQLPHTVFFWRAAHKIRPRIRLSHGGAGGRK